MLGCVLRSRADDPQRRLQPRLGVDEEVRARDDDVALLQAVPDLARRRHRDRPPRSLAARAVLRLRTTKTMFRVPLSRTTSSGTTSTVTRAAVDRDVREHLGLQLVLRVGELDAHLDGPRLLVDGRVDVRDRARPGAAGPVRERHRRLLAERRRGSSYS